jgi:hypothetical protein
MKTSYWLMAMIIVVGLLGTISIYQLVIAPRPPQPLARTLESDAVVAEHVDTTKVSRADIDLTTTQEDLSSRFAVYRFRHPQLMGKWGYLHVFVDRTQATTIPRSLWDVGDRPPKITVAGDCAIVVQEKSGVVDNYEVCSP